MPTTTATTALMKAICIHSFGGPDVLRLDEVPRPEPGPNELLIRVHAAGVNPVDWKIREGRMGQLPLPYVLGRDFSGVVEAIGPEVSNFRPGDAVFGEAAGGSGSYAEYTTALASQAAKKPSGLEHVQAAALPVASLTAWQALFDTANLQAGQRVLIHAAAGGVGSFAVQFAKQKGAYTIGTASAQNAEYLRQLGADEVIDYHATRFEDVVHDVDVVLDAIGGETQDRSWKVLKRGGILVSIVQPPSTAQAAAHGVRGVMIRQQPRGDQMAQIGEMVANGQVKLEIATVLPLHEARKAQELSQTGHTRGKIVLVIEPQGE